MNIIFAGTPEFAVPSLRMLLNSTHRVVAVYTQPDRPAGRGRKLTPSPVKEVAVQNGIPVYQPETLKTPERLAELATLAPDLIIVVAYGMILPQVVLDIPKFGCLNVHGSLLPRWRGAAPIQRAIIAGDRETGVTIMQVILKLDAGDMLHKEILPLDDQCSAGEVHDRLAELGALGLAKVLPQMENGELRPERQDEALVTYAEKLQKNEATLDWTKSAELLSRQIRGFNPWPVAQTLLHGELLRIWRAQSIAGDASLKPGTAKLDGHRLIVSTGVGWLSLLEVQLPGGKRQPISSFLNAHSLDGVVLG